MKLRGSGLGFKEDIGGKEKELENDIIIEKEQTKIRRKMPGVNLWSPHIHIHT